MHIYNLAIFDFEIPEGEIALLDGLITPGEMETNTLHLYYTCMYIIWHSSTLRYRRGRWHCSTGSPRQVRWKRTLYIFIRYAIRYAYLIYDLAVFDFEIPEGEMALLEGSPRQVRWK